MFVKPYTHEKAEYFQLNSIHHSVKTVDLRREMLKSIQNRMTYMAILTLKKGQVITRIPHVAHFQPTLLTPRLLVGQNMCW